jgi:hypothetical protein
VGSKIAPGVAGRVPFRGKDRVRLLDGERNVFVLRTSFARDSGPRASQEVRHAVSYSRPSHLDQLKYQTKDLLKAYRAGTAEAAADFAEFHPDRVAPGHAKLADAQLVVARSYHASNWTRLVQGCQLINAIWDDDLDAIERLVNVNPNLLTDTADIHGENWGPPLRSAMFLGRRRITRKLDELGCCRARARLRSCRGLRSHLPEALGGAGRSRGLPSRGSAESTFWSTTPARLREVPTRRREGEVA